MKYVLIVICLIAYGIVSEMDYQDEIKIGEFYGKQ